MTDNLPSKPKRQRRIHSAEFKAKIVALCQKPNTSRAAIARRFDLNDNLFHKWCVDAKRDLLPITAGGQFVELPKSVPSLAVNEPTVLLEYATAKGQLKIHWPLSAIDRSVALIKALNL